MTTFQDTIELLVDYLGGNPTDTVQRDCRRAVLEAYRDLTNAFRWSYLLAHGRLVTVAPIGEGTVGYVQETKLVTLDPLVGGTVTQWPAVASGSSLRIGQVTGQVVSVVAPLVLRMDDVVNFGVDIPAGTEYRLFRGMYLLPADFIANDRAMAETHFYGMDFVHPREWVAAERQTPGEGTPRVYTITGHPLFPGRLAIRFLPVPDTAQTIDYLYHRAPRPLNLPLANAGTVTMVAGDTLVTGAGTAFHAGMVGSVFRISATASAPTGVAGKNPALLESVVQRVASPTALLLAEPSPRDLLAMAYTVSDRIDIEETSMLNAFNRCCELHLSMNRTLKDKPSAAVQYRAALGEARAADSRTFSGRAVGDNEGGWPLRLRDRGPIVLNESS